MIRIGFLFISLVKVKKIKRMVMGVLALIYSFSSFFISFVSFVVFFVGGRFSRSGLVRVGLERVFWCEVVG